MKQIIIKRYSDGADIHIISKEQNISHDKIMEILHNYKKENTVKRTFTDGFRKMIASRDLNGISRNQISRELQININTVRRSCEKFGEAIKFKKESNNIYKEISGDFTKENCPKCNSKNVNEVYVNTIYCMSCGGEHVFYNDSVYAVIWENVE